MLSTHTVPVQVWSVRQPLPMVHVEDLAHATVLAGERTAADGGWVVVRGAGATAGAGVGAGIGDGAPAGATGAIGTSAAAATGGRPLCEGLSNDTFLPGKNGASGSGEKSAWPVARKTTGASMPPTVCSSASPCGQVRRRVFGVTGEDDIAKAVGASERIVDRV